MATKADRRQDLRAGRLTYEGIAAAARSEREMRELYDLHRAIELRERAVAGRCRVCGAVPCARWSTCPRGECSRCPENVPLRGDCPCEE